MYPCTLNIWIRLKFRKPCRLFIHEWMSGISLCVQRALGEVCYHYFHIVMLLVISTFLASLDGSDYLYTRANSSPWMSMGDIMTITSTASLDIVRNALITLIADSLWTAFIYMTDLITFVSKNRRLERTQPLFIFFALSTEYSRSSLNFSLESNIIPRYFSCSCEIISHSPIGSDILSTFLLRMAANILSFNCMRFARN